MEQRGRECDRGRPPARQRQRARRDGARCDVRRRRSDRGGLKPFATGGRRPRYLCECRGRAGGGRSRRPRALQAPTVQSEYDAYMASIPDGPRRTRAKLWVPPRRPAYWRCGWATTSTTSCRSLRCRRGRACSSRSRRRRWSTRSSRSCGRSCRTVQSEYRPRGPEEMTSKRCRRISLSCEPGSLRPRVRTAEQTETVRFHTEQTFFQFNRTLRELAVDRRLDCASPRGCWAT